MKKTIVVKNITKRYKLYDNAKDRALDLIIPKHGQNFYALADVSFEAEEGEIIGFVGVNGSGKSTLSNIIAGIVPETSGRVIVDGQTALIAVSAGLNNELTGRDNIELKLLMLGFNKKQIKSLEPEIIEFSELGKFIDQPVKSYSSGMKSRLGFAISISIDPEIMIIDEALSVGDKAFAEKSLAKMKEFKNQGKTMIFVSHSIGQMRAFCNKILWLENGMVKEYGDVEEVLLNYEEFLVVWQKMTDKERNKYRLKSLELQQRKLENESFKYELDVNDFYESEENNIYIENPVSVLAHIRSGKSYIYSSLKNMDDKEDSSKYKNKVYYVKRQAFFLNKSYYLLSEQPSGVNGVVGWIDVKDTAAHRYVKVDEDRKLFSIEGRGSAYNLPWGGKLNIVYSDLYPMQDKEFYVIETSLVGQNVWYKGSLEGRTCWVHQNHLIPKV